VSDPAPIPFGARFWRLWKPLWKHREAVNGLLYPFLLMFTVLVLISPYMVFNRMAAWADHTPLSAETVAQRDTLKFSQQDERTAWDPKSLFKDDEGRYLDYKIPVVDWSIWFYLSLFAYYLGFYAARKNDRGRAESLVMAQGWVISSWIAFPFFFFFPADIDLRWQLNLVFLFPSGHRPAMAVEPRADDAALPVPVQGVPCAGQAVQCLAVSAHSPEFHHCHRRGAVVDAAQMDLGHVAALAGLGWIVGERTYHQAAFHLGHHHGYAAGCGGLVFRHAARFSASRCHAG